jgi:hypothetical protein
MRNLDISDTRDKLMVYRKTGVLPPAGTTALPLLGEGTPEKD